MATITPTAMTYAEWALRHDKDGKVSYLIDLLSQTNAIVEDAISVECQSGNAYEWTQVVKLPVATKRMYNQGVPSSLAGVAKQTTTCSEYADWVKYDASLAQLNGQIGELRAQELGLHMEGVNQQIASDLFYGSRATDPTAFTGFANIYNTVNTSTSEIARNVIDCGGTGSDNASMWLVTWGPRQAHLIHPNGSQMGIAHTDYGLLPAQDSNGNEYPAYRDWIAWKIGLAVEDWRFVVRACNIDISDLNTGSAANLINILVKMVHRPPIMPRGVMPIQDSDARPPLTMGRSAVYVNRSIGEYLDLQAMNKTNVLLQMREWNGEQITLFRGIPVRTVDALLDTESRVT